MGTNDCVNWIKEIGVKGMKDDTRCYANKAQTEALLKWHNNKYGTIDIARHDIESAPKPTNESKPKPIFKAYDPVWHILYGNGTVTFVDPRCPSEYSVLVQFRNKEGKVFSKMVNQKGEERAESGIAPRKVLYHGHDLKIMVREKLPVRLKERWVYLHADDMNNVFVSQHFMSKDYCDASAKRHTELGGNVIAGPIEIKLKECKNDRNICRDNI